MTSVRVSAVAFLVFVLSGQLLVAESPFRYREYTLESSVASVLKISGQRESETKTLHQRPASIQELEWRAPYARAGAGPADPVRDVVFSFYDDQLYQVVVTYSRDRMDGLTNDDLIQTLSAAYGTPLLQNSRPPLSANPADVAEDITVLAQWEDPVSLLTLTRNTYSPQFQLVLSSKTLTPRARAAIKEALRLNTQEAPQRELDQRNKAIADTLEASEKARVVNKAAFRP